MSEEDVHWTLRYPDTVLAISGTIVGAGLGGASHGVVGALTGGVFGALASLVVGSAKPPEYGPHH